ncbi:carboxylating nicotinate-nucleotide diphosphorylase [Thermoflexibacter ruber]|uniref:Probable nicotinate-nucleotide pyrophosphorylase [carboxylating] n=1 Tax=Thermoflexibacter ruber TaxID=1003 RepID=A0A1I2AHR6_9BACT|nr:carboxylating nicotinate-nucleotide diphosphorylase [Thermoflexibacter ruber]SFE43257.1 nicotinate-nucleotide pyrophosphorylase [carboxylating] [Thermoflexibacter ruber]
MKYDYLTSESINQFIDRALQEDVGEGDHSSLSAVPAHAVRKARLLVKEDCVLAGVTLAERIFKRVNPELQLNIAISDGTEVKKGEVAFVVAGKAQSILTAERLVLNCMQRMSAIATQTRKAVNALAGTKTKVLDTRKTTPNFRLMEKWAVKIGGGENHRFGLFDMIMLKDNHIDYAGGVSNAIKAAIAYKEKIGKDLRIEVETRNLEEVREAMQVGRIEVIMLDNMSLEMMKEAVKLIDGKYLTEASGGLQLADLPAVAACGVDFISMGALTHSAKAVDLSLKAF